MFRILNAMMLVAVLLGTSHAALVDYGGGLIYDTSLNITWLQDANYAHTTGYSLADTDGRMTWSVANTWADNLSYYDSVRGVNYADWRLPSTVNATTSIGDTTGTTSEMSYMFYTNLGYEPAEASDPNPQTSILFPNLVFRSYWSGTEYNPNNAWQFHFHTGEQYSDGKGEPHYAWAVRNGAPVPIPTAAWLLGSGLLGLVALKRKK